MHESVAGTKVQLIQSHAFPCWTAPTWDSLCCRKVPYTWPRHSWPGVPEGQRVDTEHRSCSRAIQTYCLRNSLALEGGQIRSNDHSIGCGTF